MLTLFPLYILEGQKKVIIVQYFLWLIDILAEHPLTLTLIGFGEIYWVNYYVASAPQQSVAIIHLLLVNELS